VKKTGQERDREAREAKLEHIRAQVSSGTLVIRQMTHRERATWSKRRVAFEAAMTPAERSKRDAVLKNRRQRAERLARQSRSSD
jgi:hypothetical protein